MAEGQPGTEGLKGKLSALFKKKDTIPSREEQRRAELEKRADSLNNLINRLKSNDSTRYHGQGLEGNLDLYRNSFELAREQNPNIDASDLLAQKRYKPTLIVFGLNTPLDSEKEKETKRRGLNEYQLSVILGAESVLQLDGLLNKHSSKNTPYFYRGEIAGQVKTTLLTAKMAPDKEKASEVWIEARRIDEGGSNVSKGNFMSVAINVPEKTVAAWITRETEKREARRKRAT